MPTGLRSINPSLGTSASCICTGASQSGLRGLAGVGTVGHVPRTGSLGGINDLDRVATSVRAPTVTPTHLCDVTAADQLRTPASGVVGGVAVIGIGDFANIGGVSSISSVGSMGMLGVPGRTMTSRLPSASSHQPLQVMPSARSPARVPSPQLPLVTWNTRL